MTRCINFKSYNSLNINCMLQFSYTSGRCFVKAGRRCFTVTMDKLTGCVEDGRCLPIYIIKRITCVDIASCCCFLFYLYKKQLTSTITIATLDPKEWKYNKIDLKQRTCTHVHSQFVSHGQYYIAVGYTATACVLC